MKVQVLVPLSLVVSVALLGLMKFRQKDQDVEMKRNRFVNIKLRVSDDVLREYQRSRSETEESLAKITAEQKTLLVGASRRQVEVDEAKGKMDICRDTEKNAKNELESAQSEFNNFKAEADKDTSSWKTEVETLKQQLAEQSAICDFVKKDSQLGSKLCAGKVETPKEIPKADAQKQEEAKAEAPKQEEAKAEAPTPEEAKAEAPKPEEAKAEAPKPEEAKAEAPKPEEAKAEAPKPEEAKAEAPKPEEAKAVPEKR
ncbi:neurofilament heavy polypeptide [Scophthalmus maximus]|uniref:neurofilament heavy polypeptide n=1 Tax=Scophthalmus maximus TaxID=52904 RepID=UPI001FA87AF3|nr:neurofilament heavy polypeptide [Scophthalmus maximus]